jgi:hypothetical protein
MNMTTIVCSAEYHLSRLEGIQELLVRVVMQRSLHLQGSVADIFAGINGKENNQRSIPRQVPILTGKFLLAQAFTILPIPNYVICAADAMASPKLEM